MERRMKMMNNLSTQIATTREQSERLLSMGMKPETADMHYSEMPTIAAMTDETCRGISNDETEDVLMTGRGFPTSFPAWSLSRLISMMPKHIISNECECELYIVFHPEGISVYYEDDYMEQPAFFSSEDIISLCVSMIDWLIENNHFNKEYLK